jgi:hypothetical protein
VAHSRRSGSVWRTRPAVSSGRLGGLSTLNSAELGMISEATIAGLVASGCVLQDAIDGIGERIAILKVSSPERFTVPLEGYGSSVFT